MARVRSDFRNRAEALGVSALAALVPASPEGAEVFGRRLGLLYRRLDATRRRLAEANVAAAFPDKTPGEIEAFVRDVFAHFGGVAAEILYASGRPIGETLGRIEVAGGPLALAAAGSGRGVFLLTAHLGCWEWAALATSAIGVKVAVVARPLDNPLLDARLTVLRTSTGNRVIPKREAAREMLRTLKQGGAIGILMDQHAVPNEGVAVPFFGRPASTASAVARLVDRTEALVLPAAALRIGPARWRLTFDEPLDVRALARAEREAAPLTARLNRVLENLIRRAPEQWLWLHNRWRPVPEPAS
jgi:KDO2-lipid IV(A) lauroyltransferase